jgi:hypothetical protein
MLKSSTHQEKCYTHLSLAKREEIAIASWNKANLCVLSPNSWGEAPPPSARR